MQKHVFLGYGARYCNFDEIFHPQGMCGIIYNNGFPAIFDGPSEFLHKMQKRIYLLNGARYSHFEEIFDLQGVHRVICNYSPKTVFLPFLGRHLEILRKMQNVLSFVKYKNMLILKTVRDRTISTKFLTPRLYTEYSFSQTVSQKSFSRHFWWPSCPL